MCSGTGTIAIEIGGLPLVPVLTTTTTTLMKARPPRVARRRRQPVSVNLKIYQTRDAASATDDGKQPLESGIGTQFATADGVTWFPRQGFATGQTPEEQGLFRA